VICHCVCRNRRCLDPVLPDITSSTLNSSPADDSRPCSNSLSNDVVADSNDGKATSFDRTFSDKRRRGVAEATKTTSPGRTVSDVSAGGSADELTPSTYRRRSQKFSAPTTWSRFRQQKATALTSCSDKVPICWTYVLLLVFTN